MKHLQTASNGTQYFRFSGRSQNPRSQKKSVLSQARQVVDQCAKLTSATSSKRSTAASAHPDDQDPWAELVRIQNNPDTRQQIVEYFQVADTYVLSAFSEVDGAAHIFAPPDTRRDLNESNLNRSRNSDMDVVKIGRSIRLSKEINLKSSLLVPHPGIENRAPKTERETRPRSIVRNNSLLSRPHKRTESVSESEVSRSCALRKMSEIRGLVDCSAMNPFAKKVIHTKMGSLRKFLDEHFAQRREVPPAPLHNVYTGFSRESLT